MPILVNAYIFILAPKQAPFFIRPLMNVIMGQMNAKIVEPRMKENAKLVSGYLPIIARMELRLMGVVPDRRASR
jgi:glutathione S-transferase